MPTTYRLLASAEGQLQLLAWDSVYGAAYAYSGTLFQPARWEMLSDDTLTLHDGDTDPILIYAVNGDLVNVVLGESYTYQQSYGGVTCTDIDLRCVHMTYLQAALLHIPAIVVHGNSISREVWSCWYTQAHVLGGWSRRLAARRQSAEAQVGGGGGADGAERDAENAESSPMGEPPTAGEALRGQMRLL